VKALLMEAIRKTLSSVMGCARRDVREPVSVEELEGSVADHAHRQTDSRPAVQDPSDSGLHPKLIDSEELVIRVPDLRVGE